MTLVIVFRSLRAMTERGTDSKIDLLDPPETVTKKIRKAIAAPRIIEENGVMAFVEFVLLPATALRGRKEFRVDRDRDGLKPLIYTAIADIHEDYKKDIVRFIYLLSGLYGLALIAQIADTPIIEACGGKGSKRDSGSDPSRISGLKRMARNSPQSISASSEKGKEGQRQGVSLSRREGQGNGFSS